MSPSDSAPASAPRPADGAPARALSFDLAAAQYAAARPGYPPVLYEAVEELAGRPLRGAVVVDVGAGTGLATRGLTGRGARVIAVEPGPAMAAELRRALPEAAVVRGDGNRLPLASGSADLVTYAQSWHWTDPPRSYPEAVRVLRPGGALALWWNVADEDVPWVAAQDARLRRFLGARSGAHDTPQAVRRDLAGPAADPVLAGRLLPWTRAVPVETHLANLSSHSAFLVLGPDRAGDVRRFLADERARLLERFPDGVVEERYVVELTVLTP
ncbi:class I SAM-dependent methyltransferase [uncultured Streptomyces sp.]|uniref:class I SAM-dependent methyltransferase n=1 Tax=uncultured Streptomyces sp. TaxID=174707 RepID=UPI00263245CD|nr:class I SAM-dependent methyltransferase [uncultured Streptomyces sp.]